MMKAKPRVAIYIPSLRVGGAERVTINIANGLAAQDYPVDLLFSFEDCALASQISDDVAVTSLNMPHVPAAGIGASIPSLRNYVEKTAPEVLISAMTHANIISIAAIRFASTDPVHLATEHNEFGTKSSLKGHLVNSLAARAYTSVDRLIAVSDGVAKSLVSKTAVDRESVSVLYNPVDVESIRRRSKAPLEDPWLDDKDLDVIFTVGRLERQKDIPTLLEAFERVRRRRSGTRLIVAGRGSRRDALRSLADRMGIRDEVSFPGFVDNPYAYMDRADVFALSSVHEGLPTVLVEALACGCPVVSTDCPSGPREILADGEFGYLVPVGDPDSLAEAILSVFADPPESNRLRERGADFGIDVAIDRYTELVDRMVREE